MSRFSARALLIAAIASVLLLGGGPVLAATQDAQGPPTEAELTVVSILVEGQPVISTQRVLESESDIIIPLKAALKEQVGRIVADDGGEAAREVTIMGDKAMPYSLLKRVMATCTEAAYGRISLAVVQKGVDREASS